MPCYANSSSRENVKEQPVTNQVALVTGGGQGIGRAVTLRLAQDGMDIVVADLQSEPAEAVAAEVRLLGRSALALAVDVARETDRQRMVDETLAHFGRLDVLVNNAGINRFAMPLDVTEEHWDTVMDVNSKAVYFCCRLALRVMLQQRSGRIINIASMAGKLASTIYHPVYNVSKAAVIALTRTLALAHAADGVRVNAVCPGVVDTPMQDQVDREIARITGRAPDQIRAERVARIPLGRVEHPDEVAAVVSFLAGPDSRYITGEALVVSGGIWAGW
jgi:NAD(P)-dependent dehydrogenase (short-subunit alcohol dehydrogenase family)